MDTVEAAQAGDSDTTNQPDSIPYGIYNFRLQVMEEGDTASATVFYSTPLPANVSWYKYDRINGWSDYSEYVTISEDRKSVTLTFTDGGAGDSDGVANGLITDPSGPVVITSSREGGTGEGWHWCFITAICPKDGDTFARGLVMFLFPILIVSVLLYRRNKKQR
jgi:hypothetical protein